MILEIDTQYVVYLPFDPLGGRHDGRDRLDARRFAVADEGFDRDDTAGLIVREMIEILKAIIGIDPGDNHKPQRQILKQKPGNAEGVCGFAQKKYSIVCGLLNVYELVFDFR
jgi:hypothetical protein